MLAPLISRTPGLDSAMVCPLSSDAAVVLTHADYC